MTRLFRYAFHLLFAVLLIAFAAWSVTAFRLHLSGIGLALALGSLALAVVAAGVIRLRSRRKGWAVLAIAVLAVASWYQTIRPQEHRDWAVDVSRGVQARVDGDAITLNNVRDFKWTSASDADAQWISATYDLDQLETVDMLTSVWDSPDIAHLLVSFGFAGGQQVAFSVEIRREADEIFNEIGGFFRQFELVLIAATEDDIVRLRTNHRGEDVSLFPVNLTPEQRRTMFMSYVELAQKLENRPQFYNTLGANCTTVVYGLAQSLKPDLPLDWRLVLSGNLPEYLDDLGVLGGQGDMTQRRAAAKISERAMAHGDGPGFSAAIRP
ncbi:DUF4105 domain-containing protein [Tropicibacter naphthalenivorans]|uniref:Lnb N-terminal periplasmic domain-containing protein n=1 Tax=Tropicibacter naphthalenivorans TaxID=441103 RepID=A0A0P1GI03_9RHOB|nr:DUF4105 domain-containing protein [Tropicibacter naphthalenivorans]CUH75867.1 hypothetical protein TRN7648_00664 [Tropicibacter naphthalenivorans]SMC41742.1 protein of unknown function [Tropicibacter naphthalenivorans]